MLAQTLFLSPAGTDSADCGSTFAGSCLTVSYTLEHLATEDTVIINISDGTYNTQQSVSIGIRNVTLFGSQNVFLETRSFQSFAFSISSGQLTLQSLMIVITHNSFSGLAQITSENELFGSLMCDSVHINGTRAGTFTQTLFLINGGNITLQNCVLSSITCTNPIISLPSSVCSHSVPNYFIPLFLHLFSLKKLQ